MAVNSIISVYIYLLPFCIHTMGDYIYVSTNISTLFQTFFTLQGSIFSPFVSNSNKRFAAATFLASFFVEPIPIKEQKSSSKCIIHYLLSNNLCGLALGIVNVLYIIC